jgi:hypothetical protein
MEPWITNSIFAISFQNSSFQTLRRRHEGLRYYHPCQEKLRWRQDGALFCQVEPNVAVEPQFKRMESSKPNIIYANFAIDRFCQDDGLIGIGYNPIEPTIADYNFALSILQMVRVFEVRHNCDGWDCKENFRRLAGPWLREYGHNLDEVDFKKIAKEHVEVLKPETERLNIHLPLRFRWQIECAVEVFTTQAPCIVSKQPIEFEYEDLFE